MKCGSDSAPLTAGLPVDSAWKLRGWPASWAIEDVCGGAYIRVCARAYHVCASAYMQKNSKGNQYVGGVCASAYTHPNNKVAVHGVASARKCTPFAPKARTRRDLRRVWARTAEGRS